MAIVGFMVGMMIGRLTTSEPARLEQIEVVEGGLVLWFDHETKVRADNLDGVVALLIEAHGQAAQGQTQWEGKPVRWRVEEGREGLSLNLLAARPLQGGWVARKENGRWRLEVSLHE